MLKIIKIFLSLTIFSSCATTQPEKVGAKFFSPEDCIESHGASCACTSFEDLKKIYVNYVLSCQSYRTPEEVQRLLETLRVVGAIDKF